MIHRNIYCLINIAIHMSLDEYDCFFLALRWHVPPCLEPNLQPQPQHPPTQGPSKLCHCVWNNNIKKEKKMPTWFKWEREGLERGWDVRARYEFLVLHVLFLRPPQSIITVSWSRIFSSRKRDPSSSCPGWRFLGIRHDLFPAKKHMFF